VNDIAELAMVSVLDGHVAATAARDVTETSAMRGSSRHATAMHSASATTRWYCELSATARMGR
jgi:hypothetical protein